MWDQWSDQDIPKSNFFKFDKVGAVVVGVLVAVEDKPAKDNFPAQRVFTLKQRDGALVKVGISMQKDYVISRASQARLGDMVKFEYKKDVPSSKKGMQPAKSIEVYVKHVATSEDDLGPAF